VPTSFKVNLHLPASERGRDTPLRSGSRALARLGESERLSWGLGVDITFDAPAQLAPGDTDPARITAYYI
jgi:hypothetical protein